MHPSLPNQSQPKRVHFNSDARLSVTRFDSAVASASPNTDKIATLNGYAMLWNVLSDDRGGYKVRLLPGSAKPDNPTMALFHHDAAKILGNTDNTTLRLFPDDLGVRVEIDAPDTTTGRDAAVLVAKKYARGMSFAIVGSPKFTVTTEAGQKIVNISDFVYDEVTVTAIPSFTQTFIDIADDEDALDPTGLQASKKILEPLKERDLQALKVLRYRLAALAEFQH